MNERETESVKLLIRSLMDVGRFAAARDLLRGLAAEEGGADDPFVTRNLTRTLLHLGEYGAAEPLARREAERARGADKAPALFFLAYALWGLNRQEECRETVEQYAASLANG